MAERYRNYGIDLLRMLTMLMIVIMHVLGNGGILLNEKLSGINCEIAWFLEVASYCAVNCYAMVTGYVYVNARYRYSRIFELWLQVVFYSVLIYLVVIIFIPGEFDILIFLQTFFPAKFSQYWYFTAYFCIFFFIPLFNHILNTVPKDALKVAIFSAVIIFSILPCVFGKDIFLTNMGYSPLWCAVLYIIGGYIKKYGVLKNKRKLIVTGIYFSCVLLTCVLKMIADITNADKFGERFISYTSPFILLSAVALVVVFSALRLPKVVKKLILILSPCAFGVYLIHVHPMIFKYVLKIGRAHV